jgi:hypothetical protein
MQQHQQQREEDEEKEEVEARAATSNEMDVLDQIQPVVEVPKEVVLVPAAAETVPGGGGDPLRLPHYALPDPPTFSPGGYEASFFW